MTMALLFAPGAAWIRCSGRHQAIPPATRSFWKRCTHGGSAERQNTHCPPPGKAAYAALAGGGWDKAAQGVCRIATGGIGLS